MASGLSWWLLGVNLCGAISSLLSQGHFIDTATTRRGHLFSIGEVVALGYVVVLDGLPSMVGNK